MNINILMEARILAISDVVESIAPKRPYTVLPRECGMNPYLRNHIENGC